MEFFKRVGQHYHKSTPVYDFEPHVAEDIFSSWLNATPGIDIFFHSRIESLSKEGNRLISMTTNGPAGTVVGKIFIDCSYSGDLINLAGVPYSWGREGVSVYNESLAGRLKEPSHYGDHQFLVPIDPYDKEGKVLPLVYGGNPGTVGEVL